ncbi:hypothetical protein R6Q57_014926 [Mikania cordata]
MRFEQITPLDVLDKKVKEWRDQYEGRFVGASNLVDNIHHLEDKDDFNFRLNFVMMFVIVLVECTKNGRMKEDILKYFYHGTDFKQFDRCDFIIEKTKGCKSGWMPYDNRSPFTDPLTILTVDVTKFINVKEKGKAGDKGWGFKKGRLKEFVGVEERDTGEGDQNELLKMETMLESLELLRDQIVSSFKKMYKTKKNIEHVDVLQARYCSIVEVTSDWLDDKEAIPDEAANQIKEVLEQ